MLVLSRVLQAKAFTCHMLRATCRAFNASRSITILSAVTLLSSGEYHLPSELSLIGIERRP